MIAIDFLYLYAKSTSQLLLVIRMKVNFIPKSIFLTKIITRFQDKIECEKSNKTLSSWKMEAGVDIYASDYLP